MDHNARRDHRRTRAAAKYNLESLRHPRGPHNRAAFLPICKFLRPLSVGVHPRKLFAVRVGDHYFVMIMLATTVFELRHGWSKECTMVQCDDELSG